MPPRRRPVPRPRRSRALGLVAALHGSNGAFTYAAPPNSLTVVTVKGPHG
jgi:hypothetical protein